MYRFCLTTAEPRIFHASAPAGAFLMCRMHGSCRQTRKGRLKTVLFVYPCFARSVPFVFFEVMDAKERRLDKPNPEAVHRVQRVVRVVQSYAFCAFCYITLDFLIPMLIHPADGSVISFVVKVCHGVGVQHNALGFPG